VVVVETCPARAYPVRVLGYHEIVNDVLGDDVLGDDVLGDDVLGDDVLGDDVLGDDVLGDDVPTVPGTPTSDGPRPIAVTWCPICASAVVYDRRVDGRTLTFGTSGKLADDALVLYDRETGSEWKQPLGRAIAGPLAGRELAVVPAALTSWRAFRAEYPDGVVLQPVHGGDAVGYPIEQVRDDGGWSRTLSVVTTWSSSVPGPRYTRSRTPATGSKCATEHCTATGSRGT
jgi:hypothetical protein